MKAPITFAVLALHAAVITTILIGCNSTGEQPQVNPELADDAAVAENQTPDTPPPAPMEGSQDFRAIPTRPTQNLQAVDSSGYPMEEKEPSSQANELETIPPAQPSTIEPMESKTPAPEIEASEYKVKAGDNLSKIAKRHGVSLSELLEANNLSRNSIIRIGQIIKVPAGGKPVEDSKAMPAQSSNVPTTGYVVQKGDSLSKIAIKFNTSVRKIMELNGLKSTNIRVGQKLKLPEVNSAKLSDRAESLKGKRVHKLAKGETLGLLSKKYNVSIAKLMDLNSIKDPRKIRAGQVIIVGEESIAKEAATVQTPVQQAPEPKKVESEPSQSQIKVLPDASNEVKSEPSESAPEQNQMVQPILELPEIQEI